MSRISRRTHPGVQHQFQPITSLKPGEALVFGVEHSRQAPRRRLAERWTASAPCTAKAAVCTGLMGTTMAVLRLLARVEPDRLSHCQ